MIKNLFAIKFLRKFLPIVACVIALCLLVFSFVKSNEHVSYSKNEGLGIKDILNKVKTELAEVRKERLARKEDAMFMIKSLDLEINFVIKTQVNQSGKVEYEFIAVEAGNEVSREKTQKITLHMETIPLPSVRIEAADKPIESKPTETEILDELPK